jgi:hypothetical protein
VKMDLAQVTQVITCFTHFVSSSESVRLIFVYYHSHKSYLDRRAREISHGEFFYYMNAFNTLYNLMSHGYHSEVEALQHHCCPSTATGAEVWNTYNNY